MDALGKFENHLRFEKQAAKLTIIAYMRDLNQFQTYLDAPILSTCHKDIRSFIVWQVENGDAPKSINRRIASLHSFFKFALVNNLIEKDPSELVQNVKQPKKIPVFITENQLEKIIDNSPHLDFQDMLEFTIIYMLYSTGLRRSELANLKESDVDFNQGTIIVVGKGEKSRVVPISSELNETLNTYLHEKNRLLEKNSEQNICESHKKALFLSNKLKPITHDQIYAIIKKTVKRFGLSPDVSPHTLRHTFATHLLNQNVQLRSIQELLGHANLKTTQIYTHTSTEELKKSFINAHPRGKKS